MKYLRIISLVLCCLLLLGMFVACKNEETTDTDTEAATTADTTADTSNTEPETTEPKDDEGNQGDQGNEGDGGEEPAYTGPAIRNETWNTGDITPGTSNVQLEQGSNDPAIEWN